MDESVYRQVLAQIEGMSAEQVEGVLESLKARHGVNHVERLLLARLSERHCPHCAGERIVKNGNNKGIQRFLCRDCAKTFAATTGTPFHRLREKVSLLDYAACMADGLSIRQSAARVGMTIDKSFRWRHKFLAFLNTQKPEVLKGVVEADETSFPVSYKG